MQFRLLSAGIMGISDRDYVRYDNRGGAFTGRGLDVLGWLIIANIGVFILQLVWTRPDGVFGVLRVPVLNTWFALAPDKVLHGQVWRLLSYDFLHDQHYVWHIVFNMYVLYIAGSRLRSLLSPREFLLFYLTSGFTAGLAFLLWQLYRGSTIPAIGASGSVAAVLLLYALHWPRDVWMILGIIPVPIFVIVGLTVILDLYPVLWEIGQGRSQSNIAHTAHLGGMAFAILYYQRQWRLEPLLNAVLHFKPKRLFRPRPNLRVHTPADDPLRTDAVALQARVDELLDKIHREGEHALSPEEREVLNTASRLLRNRRQGAS
ncbi:MAG: rhomboid family intramembrane serine protease [Planctomyces sp.]|nr:rhomboid family intramembrane serine protease [Planctomyces sp.]